MDEHRNRIAEIARHIAIERSAQSAAQSAGYPARPLNGAGHGARAPALNGSPHGLNGAALRYTPAYDPDLDAVCSKAVPDPDESDPDYSYLNGHANGFNTYGTTAAAMAPRHMGDRHQHTGGNSQGSATYSDRRHADLEVPVADNSGLARAGVVRRLVATIYSRRAFWIPLNIALTLLALWLMAMDA